jgi:hypothetical protein
VDNNNISIALLVWKSRFAELYRGVLAAHGITVVLIDQEESCAEKLQNLEINGILADVGSVVSASPQTKAHLAVWEQVYPYARIRFNSEKSMVELLAPLSLKEFLEERCRGHLARRPRGAPRWPASLSALAVSAKGWSVYAGCSNLSVTGLFLSGQEPLLAVGEKVKLGFSELKNALFAEGTIVRRVGWGEVPYSAPGVGIRFDSMQGDYKNAYADLILRAKRWGS